MQTDSKVVLFEQTPIPKAVAQLAVPTVLSAGYGNLQPR